MKALDMFSEDYMKDYVKDYVENRRQIMNTKQLIADLEAGKYQEKLLDIYVDAEKLEYQTKRYQKAVMIFEGTFGEGEVKIYSAPGRTEVGGNHTDHQHGEVLAASINLDAIAIVRKREDGKVQIKSDGYDLVTVSCEELEQKKEEENTTLSLIKGMLAGVKDHGYTIGGFEAYVTSDVLIGAGLSSSAAFETLLGTILSYLYNDGKISAVEIAILGQYAENVYFGKPCGLMDQMASSVGNLVHIDFADPAEPVVEKVDFDLAAHHYNLCITDTKGSHANLTPDYAAVPAEMKQVAAYFGKEVLREVTYEQVIASIASLRSTTSDRAILRALHFIEENKRVETEVEALKKDDIDTFLQTVQASGDSSYKYLQNVYTMQDVLHQNMSLALAISQIQLGSDGVARVHGGGFAGTIQAFVKEEATESYRKTMDQVFGEDSCHVLKIRKYGGMCVVE